MTITGIYHPLDILSAHLQHAKFNMGDFLPPEDIIYHISSWCCNSESVGGTLTTVYTQIQALLPINPSPTTLCMSHTGFVIVSEYFPYEWCITNILYYQLTKNSVDWSLFNSKNMNSKNTKNIIYRTVSKIFKKFLISIKNF